MPRPKPSTPRAAKTSALLATAQRTAAVTDAAAAKLLDDAVALAGEPDATTWRLGRKPAQLSAPRVIHALGFKSFESLLTKHFARLNLRIRQAQKLIAATAAYDQ